MSKQVTTARAEIVSAAVKLGIAALAALALLLYAKSIFAQASATPAMSYFLFLAFSYGFSWAGKTMAEHYDVSLLRQIGICIAFCLLGALIVVLLGQMGTSLIVSWLDAVLVSLGALLFIADITDIVRAAVASKRG